MKNNRQNAFTTQVFAIQAAETFTFITKQSKPFLHYGTILIRTFKSKNWLSLKDSKVLIKKCSQYGLTSIKILTIISTDDSCKILYHDDFNS